MAKRKKADDAGQAEVQEKMDAELERGLVGNEVDQTPNENYTVGGVLAGKPTPESERAKPEEGDE